MGGSVRDKWGSVPDQVGVCVEGCLWAARWPLACAWWWQQVGEEDRFSASRSTLVVPSSKPCACACRLCAVLDLRAACVFHAGARRESGIGRVLKTGGRPHPNTTCWMGELAIVHARGLARCLNSRAARCVYETAVRNGKARGHKLPPSPYAPPYAPPTR